MQRIFLALLLVASSSLPAVAAEVASKESDWALSDVFWILAALLAPLLIVAGLIGLRARRGETPELKFPEVAMAVLPVLLALIVSGQITEFTVGPEGVAVKALEQAASERVDTRAAAFETEPFDPPELDVAMKLGLDQIPEYLRRNVQALKFEIGRRYVPKIMEAYFRTLTSNPRFRYFVLLEPGGRRLFGIMDARRLLALTDKPRTEVPVERVLTWAQVRDYIQSSPDNFGELRGFIPSETAVRTRDSRVEALAKLEEAETDWLPVVDDEVRLVGVVELPQLTAGLVRDVLGQLKGASAGDE